VTSRRTHGPPEDLLDDWGSCELLSSFRQNATFEALLPAEDMSVAGMVVIRRFGVWGVSASPRRRALSASRG